MTTREMQIQFERLLRTIYPNFDNITKEQMNSDTIMYFLTLAQDRYLKENYLNKEQIKESIEYVNKRSDVLRKLIKREEDQGVDSPYVANLNDGGIQLDLPSDYLFYLKSYAKVKRTDGYAEAVHDYTPTRIINHSELDLVTTNPIHKPILRKPAILLEGDNKIIIYVDQYTEMNNFELIYLKQPDALVIGTPGTGETNTSELAEHTHIEIVQYAVNMFIEDYKFKLAGGGDR